MSEEIRITMLEDNYFNTWRDQNYYA